jgi:hypothetical protein
MKLFKRFYHITVTNQAGKVVSETEEYSGYATSEEMMMLRREHPGCTVEAEFKEFEVTE